MRRETMRSPAIRRIAESLGLRVFEAVGILESLRHVALEHRGLEQLTRREIARLISWTRRHDSGLFEVLIVNGVLTALDHGRVAINREFFSPARPARPHIANRTRAAVMERDGRRCRACGSTEHLALDHIIPYALGGPDTIENLQVLCRTCNGEKGCAIQ